jgi:hypothetical protein
MAFTCLDRSTPRRWRRKGSESFSGASTTDDEDDDDDDDETA